MARFALSAVAAFVLFASLTGSADAGVRFTKVTPNGSVVQKTYSTTAAGKPKMTKTVIGPNGGSVSKTVVQGPYHTHTKTTVTRPNGASLTIRTRN